MSSEPRRREAKKRRKIPQGKALKECAFHGYDLHCGWFKEGDNEYTEVALMEQVLANSNCLANAESK